MTKPIMGTHARARKSVALGRSSTAQLRNTTSAAEIPQIHAESDARRIVVAGLALPANAVVLTAAEADRAGRVSAAIHLQFELEREALEGQRWTLTPDGEAALDASRLVRAS